MIQVGQSIPSVNVKMITNKQVSDTDTHQKFSSGRHVIFGIPGAYTPVCSKDHLPGFARNIPQMHQKGIQSITCVSVNDPFVLSAWAESTGANGIDMIADWDAAFTKAIGCDIDLSAAQLGIRSKRFAMIIEDGVVRHINVEESPSQCSVTSGDEIFKLL